MPCIGAGEFALLAVNDTTERGCKHKDAGAEHVVEPRVEDFEDARWVSADLLLKFRQYRFNKDCDEGGRYAVSHDIGDENAESVRLNLPDVKKIAADGHLRATPRGDAASAQLLQAVLREQDFLNAACHLQFFFQAPRCGLLGYRDTV